MKIRRFIRLSTGLLLVMWFSACEKAVRFDLETSEPKLVVEATIENGQPPVVILTKSLNYFSAISPELLAGSFVHGAVVSVSDGTQTHRLKEYTVPLSAGYNLYYYTTDSSSLATEVKGALNGRYTLQIATEGREYTARTTIPAFNKKIDSIWWKPVPLPAEDTTKVVVMARATDPKGFGDYVRYYTQRNSEPFYPGLASVYDDFFIDGTTYEIQVEPGVNRNVQSIDETNLFSRGDTMVFKLSSIDRATYDFWRTMEFSYASVGNPFSSPIKVIGNISNGALGYFGGYASQFYSLIIPK